MQNSPALSAPACLAPAQALLADATDPQAELLSLIWGPRLDRTQALQCWMAYSQRQPQQATALLPELLQAADHYDALPPPEQQRLREWVRGSAAPRAVQ